MQHASLGLVAALAAAPLVSACLNPAPQKGLDYVDMVTIDGPDTGSGGGGSVACGGSGQCACSLNGSPLCGYCSTDRLCYYCSAGTCPSNPCAGVCDSSGGGSCPTGYPVNCYNGYCCPNDFPACCPDSNYCADTSDTCSNIDESSSNDNAEQCVDGQHCYVNASYYEACATPDGSSCSYIVHDASGNTRRFDCGSCSNLTVCAQQAVDYLATVCHY